MPDVRLVTIEGEVYEVVAEAPGRTSMFLVNRTRKARTKVEELERLLAAARAELVTVEGSRERNGAGADHLDVHSTELRHP